MERGTWAAVAACVLAALLAGCAATVVTGRASPAGGIASAPTTSGSSAADDSATAAGGTASTRPGTATPASPAPSSRPAPGPSGLLEFTTRSRNIACVVASGTPSDPTDPGQARCDIAQADWSSPPRPDACQGDWGHALTVGPDGSRFACVTDSALNDTVVDYGTTQVRGDFSCAVAQTDVTCTDLDTGHGFAMSRERYQLF